jgi:hypothetical protein
MKQRFPDKAVLRAIIWNAGDRNANSIMMPFGQHKINRQIGATNVFFFSMATNICKEKG